LILAGRGVSAASVAISPAPHRGVLPLPFAALKSGSPVLRNPANRNRAVPLTFDQFQCASANVVDEQAAQELFEAFAVPGSGKPLFQSASANFNPWTEAKVDTENPERGPMLIIAGEHDDTIPWGVANAAFKREQRNEGETETVEMDNRGHSPTIDRGWREVAEKALAFVKRFV
jgi:non-heme chloroperoxidase